MKIISINVTALSSYDIENQIINWANNNLGGYTCVANVHMCIEAWLNAEFASVVNKASIVTADGMPLVKAMNWIHRVNQERVAGMDLLPKLLSREETNNLRILFYGGTPEMLAKTRNYLEHEYPELRTAHYISPPFKPLSNEDYQRVISYINDNKIQLVFVVLGCPKQENFMSKVSLQCKAHFVGIGGALPVLLGLQKRAPMWMQKNSLEWLYRLIQEPRRLFRRYFVTNTLFIILILKQFILSKITSKS